MKRLKGSYASYAGTIFFYYFAMASFSSTVLSVYLRNIGKNDGEIPFIISSASLFSLGMVPISGWLFDRVANTKRMYGGFFAVVGVLGLVFALCREVWILFLLYGLIASLIYCIDPLCQKVTSTSKYRYGAIRVWGTFGFALATQAGAFVISLGQAQLVFVLLLISVSLSTFFYCFTGPMILSPEESNHEKTQEKSMADEKAPGQDIHKESKKIFLKNPYFLLYLALAMFYSSMSGSNMAYSPLLLLDLGITENQVGIVLAVSTVIELPILLFSNKFMDRFNGKNLLCMAFIMSTVQYLCYGLSQSAGFTMAVLLILKATSSTLFMMISLKIVRNLVPVNRTATALGLVGFANSIGLGVMLNISGQIVQRLGMDKLYLLYAGLCVIGILLTFLLKIGNSQTVFSGHQRDAGPTRSATTQ